MKVNEEKFIEFKVNDEELHFYENSDEIGKVKISWDYIDKKFIKNPIPSEREIENAINYIEDELMRNLELLNTKNLNLCTKDSNLIKLLGVKAKIVEYTKEKIEEEFTKYALLSMGRSPVVDGIELNNKRYIALLVIREILHHLKFDSIKIIG